MYLSRGSRYWYGKNASMAEVISISDTTQAPRFCEELISILNNNYGEHVIVCIEHNKEGCTRFMRSFLM